MANIKNHLNNIKNALFGQEVRGSIHDGIDAINKEVESTTGRQVDLENTFDQLVINAGNSNAEIVDARVKNDGTSYSKLGDRLDAVDSQLEHIENIDVLKETGGTYSEKLQNALNNFSGKSGRIYLPSGIVELHEIDIPPQKQISFIGYGMTKYSTDGTRIVPQSDSTKYLFSAKNGGTDYNSFENITFDGKNTCDYGLYGNYFMGTFLKRCYFTGFNQVACELKQGLSHVEGCYFHENNGKGLIIHSDSYVTNNEFSASNIPLIVESGGNRIIGNLINGGASYGLHLKPTLNVSYSESTIPLAQNNLISGNYFGGNSDYCIFIEGDSRKNVHSNLITSNYFELIYTEKIEGAIKGLYLNNCQINDNIIIGNLNSTLDSIVLQNCENCNINNISATKVSNNIIKLINTHDCVINAINVRDCDGYGIYLDNSTRNLVANIKTLDQRSDKLLKCYYNNSNNNMFTNIDYNGLQIDDSINSYKELINGSKKLYSHLTLENGTHTKPPFTFLNGFGFYGIGTTGFACVSNGGVEKFKLNSNDFSISQGNVEVNTIGKGYILKSPNGTRFKIQVDDAGTLKTVAQ